MKKRREENPRQPRPGRAHHPCPGTAGPLRSVPALPPAPSVSAVPTAPARLTCAATCGATATERPPGGGCAGQRGAERAGGAEGARRGEGGSEGGRQVRGGLGRGAGGALPGAEPRTPDLSGCPALPCRRPALSGRWSRGPDED